MEDNIIIENILFTEEMYKKAIQENEFSNDNQHGIGDEINGNS